MWVLYSGQIEFEDVGFVGGIPEKPEENPRNKARTNNKFTHQAGIEPRPLWWKTCALTTVPSEINKQTKF